MKGNVNEALVARVVAAHRRLDEPTAALIREALGNTHTVRSIRAAMQLARKAGRLPPWNPQQGAPR